MPLNALKSNHLTSLSLKGLSKAEFDGRGMMSPAVSGIEATYIIIILFYYIYFVWIAVFDIRPIVVILNVLL